MSAGQRAELWATVRQSAWNQFRVRWARLRREVGSGKGRRDWPARRDRVEASDGLMVVVDLATNSAMAADAGSRSGRWGALRFGGACKSCCGRCHRGAFGLPELSRARGLAREPR